jgi:hypothetical protein
VEQLPSVQALPVQEQVASSQLTLVLQLVAMLAASASRLGVETQASVEG